MHCTNRFDGVQCSLLWLHRNSLMLWYLELRDGTRSNERVFFFSFFVFIHLFRSIADWFALDDLKEKKHSKTKRSIKGMQPRTNNKTNVPSREHWVHHTDWEWSCDFNNMKYICMWFTWTMNSKCNTYLFLSLSLSRFSVRNNNKTAPL